MAKPIPRPDPNQGRVRMWSRLRQKFEDVDPLEAALCVLVDNEARLADAGLRPGALGEVTRVLRTIVDGE